MYQNSATQQEESARRKRSLYWKIRIVPGMVGRVGTLLGEHGVNIATMSLSRNLAGGTALTVLNLDNASSEALPHEISATEDIHSAQVIQL